MTPAEARKNKRLLAKLTLAELKAVQLGSGFDVAQETIADLRETIADLREERDRIAGKYDQYRAALDGLHRRVVRYATALDGESRERAAAALFYLGRGMAEIDILRSAARNPNGASTPE